MRLHRRTSLLCCLALALCLAQVTLAREVDDPEQLVALARNPGAKVEDDTAVAAALGSSPSTKEVGTKDAPVDGKDGKPHAGPWVGIDADTPSKKSSDDSTVAVAKDKLEKDYGSGAIPEKNDGVMDDRNRASPEEGTTGLEGGISEKSKKQKADEAETGAKAAKKPAAPAEAPPLPHSEQQKIKEAKADGTSGELVEKVKGAAGLQKPTDLPDSPMAKLGKDKVLIDTLPYSEGKPRKDTATSDSGAKSTTSTSSQSSGDGAEGLIQPSHSFFLAFLMILFSEIGDKTFLVAALMAMRHDRLVVFTAAFSALIAMTVLSAILGHAVPSLLPRRLVAFAAAGLFLVFGVKLLREGLAMPKDSGVGEEMKEVEAELEEKEHLAMRRRKSSISAHALEAGNRGRSNTGRLGNLPPPLESPTSEGSRSPSPGGRAASLSGMLGGLNNLFSLVLSPAWVQTFVMTFLGEWGDRSQIATIAMAAGPDYWWVTGGAVVGHACCTGVAVVGGRALAGKVSMRVVTIGGACAFLFFGLVYLVEAMYAGSATAI